MPLLAGPISDATDSVTTLPPPPVAAPPPPEPTAAPAPAPTPTAAQPIPQPGVPLVDTGTNTFIPAPPVVSSVPPPVLGPPPPDAAPTAGQPIPQPGHPLVDTGTNQFEPAPPVVTSGDTGTTPATGTPRVLESEIPHLGAAGRYTHLQLVQFWILANGFPGAEDVAAAIMQAESGGDPTQINNTARPARPHYHPPAKGNLPEYSVGLAQINLLAHPQYTEAQMLDPLENVRAMVALSNGGRDFSPWSTYTSGAYKKHLTAGSVADTTPPPAKPPRNPNAPPGVQKGWANVIGVFFGHVPRAHTRVKSLADELLGVFK